MPRIAIIDNVLDPEVCRPVRHWSRWLTGDRVSFEARFDEVVDPDGLLTVLARTPVCPVHAFRYGARPVWGVQADPEIDPGDGRELLEAELERGYAGGPLIERALRSVPRDDGLVRPVVAAFLRT